MVVHWINIDRISRSGFCSKGDPACMPVASPNFLGRTYSLSNAESESASGNWAGERSAVAQLSSLIYTAPGLRFRLGRMSLRRARKMGTDTAIIEIAGSAVPNITASIEAPWEVSARFSFASR